MDLIQTNGMDQGLGLGIRDKIKKIFLTFKNFFFNYWAQIQNI